MVGGLGGEGGKWFELFGGFGGVVCRCLVVLRVRRFLLEYDGALLAVGFGGV